MTSPKAMNAARNSSNEKRSPFRTAFMAAALALALPVLSGCAMMSSHEQANTNFFDSVNALEQRVDTLHIGMTKDQVFAALGMNEHDMSTLDRQGIKIALYGSADQVIQGSEAEVRAFFGDMEGYNFTYADIHKDRSFSGLKIKTVGTGYDVDVTLIFKNGELYENPIISGGRVNAIDKDPIIKPNNITGAFIP